MEKKVLVLHLKAKWYNMIESGEKKEEYREMKQYWVTRLVDGSNGAQTFKHYDEVEFVYGYTKKKMRFKVTGISFGKGNKDWGAPDSDVFKIGLGKRIS